MNTFCIPGPKLMLMLLVAALGIAACKSTPPTAVPGPPSETDDVASTAPLREAAEPTSEPSRQAVRDIKDGVEVASSWLEALARNDHAALARQTGFPFRVHSVRAEPSCEQQAATPSELPATIQCLSSDTTLISVLQKHSGGGLDALTHHDVQPWAKPWQGELQPEWRLVTAYYERGDATVELNLSVAPDGVRAVWKADGLDGTEEAQFAAQWLSALRSGDVSLLARVTQYPFELRDRGRSATCGTRTAPGSDVLPRTVQCLTSNEVFQQALRDSPELSPVVYRSADQVPGWAREWWKKQGTPALKIVTFLVATEKGDEFDLLFLADRAGVHALWKSGSFESTE